MLSESRCARRALSSTVLPGTRLLNGSHDESNKHGPHGPGEQEEPIAMPSPQPAV